MIGNERVLFEVHQLNDRNFAPNLTRQGWQEPQAPTFRLFSPRLRSPVPEGFAAKTEAAW